MHGLNGDSIKSWTSESGDTCWLNHPDFLPKYVNRCRVLTWGYNANISTLMGKKTSSDRILQHAQTLIAELHADRDVRWFFGPILLVYLLEEAAFTSSLTLNS